MDNTADMCIKDYNHNYSSPENANPDDSTWSQATLVSSLNCMNNDKDAEARSLAAKLSADTLVTSFSEGPSPRLCQNPSATDPGSGALIPNPDASEPVLNDISRPRRTRSGDNHLESDGERYSDKLVLSPAFAFRDGLADDVVPQLLARLLMAFEAQEVGMDEVMALAASSVLQETARHPGCNRITWWIMDNDSGDPIADVETNRLLQARLPFLAARAVLVSPDGVGRDTCCIACA
ncbi:Uu.00g137810.m01.CDS01 [Anthostomella pinea]|uniref:Uu.00g137810.m01.CDS01 n=1 Tax=Anthostomella pinea TaxID=933095 RepID=A0AAI8VJ58_9PEZI|nr:Uu.00g137810.m01.CDS01 [Anthostomella pinea]